MRLLFKKKYKNFFTDTSFQLLPDEKYFYIYNETMATFIYIPQDIIKEQF